MTSGTLLRDNQVATPVYDWDSNGNILSTGSNWVGPYYKKTWSGTDYPHVRPPPVSQRWWKKGPVNPNTGKWSYVPAWESRYPPKRVTQVFHPYSMDLTMENVGLVFFSRPISHTTGIRSMVPNIFTRAQRQSSSQWTSNDDLALLTKLRDKIAGSDFNMAVFLGEGHEALSMITNSATRIYRAYRAMRNLDLAGAAVMLGVTLKNRKGAIDLRRNPREISKHWLELQYGWLPLLKDAQGGAEFLSQYLGFPYRQKYRVRRTRVATWDISSWVTEGGDYFINGSTVGQIEAYLSEVNVSKLAGLQDPLSLVWELLPYSFVADWFIPIGSYLAARGLASSLTGTFVTTNVFRDRQEYFAIGKAANLVPSPGYPPYYYQRISLTRTVSSSLSIPTPNIKPLERIASWKHCANAVALLVNHFGSSPKL